MVRESVFRDHRGHAMRLRAGHGLVERNRIERVGNDGILIANDYDRGEGPNARDVVVQGNVIRDVGFANGTAGIEVAGLRLGRTPAQGRPQRDIVIEDNRIENWRGVAISISAASGVAVRGNRLRLDRRAGAEERAVLVSDGEGVEISDLVLEGLEPPRVGVEISPSVAEVTIVGLQVPAGTAPVVDERPGGSRTPPAAAAQRVSG